MANEMTPAGQAAFDNAYWLAQPGVVRTLRNMPAGNGLPGDPRLEAAKALAMQGYTIDVPIMAWGWDPYNIMLVRKNMGMAWVPSGLQAPVDLGLLAHGPVPAGSIKVSTDLADFPPFDPPPPPAPAPTNLVSGHAFANIYFSTMAGNAAPDGFEVTEQGHTFVKHVVQGLMGRSDTWELMA